MFGGGIGDSSTSFSFGELSVCPIFFLLCVLS